MADPDTPEIVSWLRDQLALDEAHAQKDLHLVDRSTAGGRWTAWYGYNLDYSELRTEDEAGRREVGRMISPSHEADAMLVSRMVRSARQRAERALREVEAKRKIIAEHWNRVEQVGWDEERSICDLCRYDNGLDTFDWPCPTLRALASVYQDRPGFQDRWRIDA